MAPSDGGGLAATDGDLAPVIPLFGGPGSSVRATPTGESDLVRRASGSSPDRTGRRDGAFDPSAGRQGPTSPGPSGEARADRRRSRPSAPRGERPADGEGDPAVAEDALLRRLRTRQLSSAEARTVLRERGLDDGATDEILERFERCGYLDDARLAEQLVHAALSRTGQGRHAIAATLTRRGVARAIVDEAMQTLPDDDFERALEFARGRVCRSSSSSDRDGALRRLAGQLARRGYGSATALSAARAALDEGV